MEIEETIAWQKARKRPLEVGFYGPITRPKEIATLEGVLIADVGDYIVRGIRGEIYPVKSDIFRETYEVESVR